MAWEILLGILLYMTIGLLLGLKHVYDFPNAKDPSEVPMEWKAEVLNSVILGWPKHLFVLVGISICRKIDQHGKED